MAKSSEVKVVISGDAKGATRAAAEAEASLGKLGKTAGQLGSVIDSKLGTTTFGTKFGQAFDGLAAKAKSAFASIGSEGSGLSSLLGPALVAGPVAAGAAIAAFATKGVADFRNLASEVAKFKNVSGTSAEDASRFVSVANKFGVATDTMARAVGILNKTLGKSPDALKKYGVEIARNNDGTVNVAKTLGNVATAYSLTVDPTKRAALAATAFGRSYQDLIPLLKQGAGLGDQLAEVPKGLVLSQKDLDANKQLSVSMRQLKEEAQSLSVELGKGIVPALADLASQAATSAQKLDGLLAPIGGLGHAIGILVQNIPGIGGLRILGDVTNSNSSNMQKFKDVVDDLLPPLSHLPFLHHSAAKAQEEQTQATAQQIEVMGGLSTKWDLYTASQNKAAAATENAAKFRQADEQSLVDQARAVDQQTQAQNKLLALNSQDISDTAHLAAQHRAAADAVNAQTAAILGLDDAMSAADHSELSFLQATKQANEAILAAAKAKKGDRIALLEATTATEDAVAAGRAYAKQIGDQTTKTKGAAAGHAALIGALQKLAAESNGPVRDALNGDIFRLQTIGKQHPTPTVSVKDQATGKLADIDSRIRFISALAASPSVSISGYDRAISQIQNLIALGQRFAGSSYTADVGLVRVGAHAAGGSIRKGDVSLVGERGPELFVAQSNGYIVPNNRLGQWSGGGTVIKNYITIQGAVDTVGTAKQIKAILAKGAAAGVR